MNRIQQLVCAVGCFGAILGSASSARSQSCPGFVDTPLTKTRLNQIAAIQRIPFNRIGEAFENFALSTIAPNREIPKNTRRFPSDERGAATNGIFTNVIPDGVLPLTFQQLGAPAIVQPDSVFYEAKALQPTELIPEYPVNPQSGAEPVDSGRYQILGFLDALSNSPAGRGAGIPAIIFLTTSGVTVGSTLR